MKKLIDKLITNLRSNALEYWTGLMIVIGLPLIAFIYFGWPLAISVFIIVNIILGVLVLRKENR